MWHTCHEANCQWDSRQDSGQVLLDDKEETGNSFQFPSFSWFRWFLPSIRERKRNSENKKRYSLVVYFLVRCDVQCPPPPLLFPSLLLSLIHWLSSQCHWASHSMSSWLQWLKKKSGLKGGCTSGFTDKTSALVTLLRSVVFLILFPCFPRLELIWCWLNETLVD